MNLARALASQHATRAAQWSVTLYGELRQVRADFCYLQYITMSERTRAELKALLDRAAELRRQSQSLQRKLNRALTQATKVMNRDAAPTVERRRRATTTRKRKSRAE